MASLIAHSPWFRFSDYEVVDGVVRPCADAQFEVFDLPSLWPIAPLDAADCVTPTQAALELLADLEEADAESPRHQVRRNELLTAWCRRYGPLGLLGHEVLRLTTPAVRAIDESGDVEWRSLEFNRVGGIWVPQVLTTLGDQPDEDAGSLTFLLADFPEADRLPLTYTIEPGYIDQDLAPRFFRGLTPQRLSSQDFWNGFMRSEEFWRSYGEPVCLIQEALVRLRDSLQKVASGGRDGGSSPWLTFLTASVSLVPTSGEDGPGLGLVGSSLLALLAVAGIQDLSGDWRLLQCRCGRWFLASHHLQRWHSESCRQRYKKRDSRARANRRQP